MQDSFAQVLSERRAVFEAMSRSSATYPHIFKLRMAVDQEIAVPRIFVLAYARFQHGRVRQLQYVLPQIYAQAINRRFGYHPRACVRIKAITVAVKSNLESASLNVGQRVGQIGMGTMQPYRHFGRLKIRACRRA